MSDLAAGRTERRLRKLLELSDRVLVMLRCGVAYKPEDLDKLEQETKAALALPKTQAEKQAEALLEMKRMVGFVIDDLKGMANDPGMDTVVNPYKGRTLGTYIQFRREELEKVYNACLETGLK